MLELTLPLSERELVRGRAALVRQFITSGTNYGVVDVHFGTALRGEAAELDAKNRPFAACMVVDRKYKRLPRSRTPIPTHVTIRLTRAGVRHTLTLPTDVIEQPTRVPSGVEVFTPRRSLPGGFDTATAGVVVGWSVRTQLAGLQQRRGLLTVGHACDSPVTLGGNPVGWLPGRSTLASPVIFRSKAAEGTEIDAALFLVGGPDLTANAFQPIANPILPFSDLLTTDRRGRSFRPASMGGPVAFTVRTPPRPETFQDIGQLKRIVEVRSADPTAFREGTSGSVWEIEDDGGTGRVACLQVGTNLGDNSVGYGQVLDDTVMEWCAGEVGRATAPAVAVSGSLRLLGRL